MKAALPRTMLLKVADYLEHDAIELEDSFWDHAEKRVTPRNIRLEIERVHKWIEQIRTACEPRIRQRRGQGKSGEVGK